MTNKRKPETLAYPENLTRDMSFTVTCELVGVNVTRDGEKWVHDKWRVVIGTPYKSEAMTLDYHTGTAHRDKARSWEDHGRPITPKAKDVLYAIGSDCSTARDMPRDEAAALDYLAAEFGYGDAGKPSDTLRTVRSLNKTLDDVRDMLRGTGVDADHFIDWAQGLDS